LRRRGAAPDAAPVDGGPPILAGCDALSSTSRRGFLFHGDMKRFDMGVRGAMRSIVTLGADALGAPVSLTHRVLSRGVGIDGPPETDPLGGPASPSASHLAFRNISRDTSIAMLNASICFAPQVSRARSATCPSWAAPRPGHIGVFMMRGEE